MASENNSVCSEIDERWACKSFVSSNWFSEKKNYLNFFIVPQILNLEGEKNKKTVLDLSWMYMAMGLWWFDTAWTI